MLIRVITVSVSRSVTVKLLPTGTVILNARSLYWISTIPVRASAMQTRCPLQSRYATIRPLLSRCSHRHHLLNVILLANLQTRFVKKLQRAVKPAVVFDMDAQEPTTPAKSMMAEA